MSADGAKLHVAVVAHDVGPVGGMEQQLFRLVLGLLDRGHRVTVVSRTCELPARQGLCHRRVPGPSRPFALGYPSFALLAALRVPGDADVVHTTGALVPGRAQVSTVHLLHAALRRTGVVRTRRDTAAYRLNAAASAVMARAAERWCYRPAVTAELVAVSTGVAAEVAEHFPAMAARTTVIRNGVDLAAFRVNPEARIAVRRRLGLDDADLAAAFVGGDWVRKGLGVAVAALAQAPGWHLVVAGEGDAVAARNAAADHGVADRLHLLGAVRDTAEVYAAADALVLPTAYETFSLATHEAAACGLPLLVTRVSGVDEVLRDGVNGWFVERDPADVATRLRILGDDWRLRRAMGLEARRAVAGLSWEAMVDGYEALYRRVAAAPRSRPRPVAGGVVNG
jgi:glycosyltransferase involved in cell wall biosynthesis